MIKILLLILTFYPVITKTQPTAPGQPLTGPGGSNYPHQSVDSSCYGSNIYDMFWIFEPADPTPPAAFVVFYWHGLTSSDDNHRIPLSDLIFLKHIAKKGYIVVYPLYQTGENILDHDLLLENNARLVKKAMKEIGYGDHVTPYVYNHDINEIRYGLVGYSKGGGVSLNLTKYLLKQDLHPPEAICAFVPSDVEEELPDIPDSTKVLVITAEEDYWNYSHHIAWSRLTHLPCTNKNFIQCNTDTYGEPNLMGIHTFPSSGYIWDKPEILNAFDFYGSWKWAVGLLNCTFWGKDCNYIFGTGDDVRYLGTWSDGTQINKATILDSCQISYINDYTNSTNSNFIIYPVPATNKIFIKKAGNYLNKPIIINIFSVSGKKLYSRSFHKEIINAEINLQNFEPGIYFISLNEKRYKLLISR